MGAIFSAEVQTGPGVHPSLGTVGTGSLPGVIRPGLEADHPPLSSANVKETVELCLHSPSAPSLQAKGQNLTFVKRTFFFVLLLLLIV